MRAGIVALVLASGSALACPQHHVDASRVAVAGGSVTEILYLLGEQSRIVATDRTSNYPPEAREFPSVGYVRALSAEGLLSLGPTLILGEDDMGPPAVLNQVAAAGVDIVRLQEQHTADGIVAKVRCIARLVGAADTAERIIARQLQPTIAALAQLQAGGSDRPRGAVILGLRDGVPLGAGRDTSGDGLLAMAGADNVFAGIDGWKPLSLEGMVKANPAFIVVPTRGVDDAGGREKLLAQPGLRLTDAARRQRLIAMDGMAMLGYGPRTLEAALALARQLHSGNGSAAAE